jgi:hypothetical protein
MERHAIPPRLVMAMEWPEVRCCHTGSGQWSSPRCTQGGTQHALKRCMHGAARAPSSPAARVVAHNCPIRRVDLPPAPVVGTYRLHHAGRLRPVVTLQACTHSRTCAGTGCVVPGAEYIMGGWTMVGKCHTIAAAARCERQLDNAVWQLALPMSCFFVGCARVQVQAANCIRQHGIERRKCPHMVIL